MKVVTYKNEIVWDWMRPEVASIGPDASIEEAVSRMKKLDLHHLVVLDGKIYLGILDARDCAGVWDKNEKVEQLMRSDVPPANENSEIREVVESFVNLRITAVPLKRNGKVTGVITATDLLRLLESHLSEQSEFSDFVEKGKQLLTQPIVQSLARLLGNAGL